MSGAVALTIAEALSGISFLYYVGKSQDSLPNLVRNLDAFLHQYLYQSYVCNLQFPLPTSVNANFACKRRMGMKWSYLCLT